MPIHQLRHQYRDVHAIVKSNVKAGIVKGNVEKIIRDYDVKESTERRKRFSKSSILSSPTPSVNYLAEDYIPGEPQQIVRKKKSNKIYFTNIYRNVM